MENAAFRSILMMLGFSALLAASSASLAASEGDFLKPVFESPYTFAVSAADEVSVSVLFDLAPPELAPDQVSIERYIASFGVADPARVTRAFDVQIEEGKGTDPHRLWITLDPAAMPGSTVFGNYHLKIDLTAPESEDPASRRRQTLDLTVAYPQSELFAIQPVVFRHTSFFGKDWSWTRSWNAPLHLEVKDGPELTDLSIHQFGAAKIGDLPVQGELETEDIPQSGKVFRLPIRVSEDFPLGDATGTLHMNSPSMPVTDVTFTVKSRAHWLTILPIVGLGLIMGHLFRTSLSTHIEGHRNRIKLKKFRLQVVKAGTLGREGDFNQELERLETELNEALGQLILSPLAELEIQLKAWQERLEKAITSFERQHTLFSVRVSDLQDLLRNDWGLSGLLRNPLATCREDLKEVERLLNQGDLITVKKNLERSIEALRSTLRKTLESWAKDLPNALNVLPSKLDPPLPHEASDKVTSALSGLRAKLKLPTPGEKKSVDAIKALLTLAYEGSQLAESLLDQLAAELAATTSTVSNILAKERDNPGLDELARKGEALQELSWEAFLDSPKEEIDWIEREIEVVTKALKEAILEPFKGEGGPQEKEVRGLIADGKYLSAARQALEHHLRGRSVKELALGKVLELAPISVMGLAPWSLRSAPPKLLPSPVRSREVELGRRIQLDIARSWREIFWAELAQFAIAGVGLALIAVMIFRGTFVGTVEDWISIFLWGFTTDVGVNTLVSRAASVAKP